MVPVTPLLKNYLRFVKGWRWVRIPKWLFGAIEGRLRWRSRVAFSWAYRNSSDDAWEIRGWAWIPYSKESSDIYNETIQELRAVLEQQTEWLRALGLEGQVKRANVLFAPQPDPWGIKKISAIVSWLKGGIQR